jgi:CheY-like chemotaxis protein
VIRKILLAEDDADDREMFASFVNERDDVDLMLIAENGVEVIDCLTGSDSSQYLPDIIILDQNMPKQNGLQTLQILKETPGYTGIPVFIYSTYADASLAIQSAHAGATEIFAKPYTMEGYHQMLDSIIERLSL